MSPLSESPVPEIGTPGSMSGVWKRGEGQCNKGTESQRRGGQQKRHCHDLPRHTSTLQLKS